MWPDQLRSRNRCDRLRQGHLAWAAVIEADSGVTPAPEAFETGPGVRGKVEGMWRNHLIRVQSDDMHVK